jgi:hypothetical protein
MESPYDWRIRSMDNLFGAILVLVLGILLLTVWPVHILLVILGWVFTIGAGLWIVYWLFSKYASR